MTGQCGDYQVAELPRIGVKANLGGDDRTGIVMVHRKTRGSDWNSQVRVVKKRFPAEFPLQFVSFSLALLSCSTPEAPPAQTKSGPTPLASVVHVDRTAREISVRNAAGIWTTAPVGIGKGGLKDKESMGDYVTPTGHFTVDLVLHDAETHNAVSAEAMSRFADDAEYRALLADARGLSKLWANMSALDFDDDGVPDKAYGTAYIGLNGAGTGPKMHRYTGIARWFSIGLHGTPKAENVGAANSGGCVHLTPDLLDRLITSGDVAVGTAVVIADHGPLAR